MRGLVKLNEAEVVSEDGYKIKYGRDTLIYTENSRHVFIPIEHLGAPYEMAIYLNLAEGWVTKDQHKTEINQVELNLIGERIRNCLTFLDRNFSIQNQAANEHNKGDGG